MSPLETAAELVRIAVDGDGNLASVYALDAANNYTLNYNDKDMRIARFSPAGKFVKAFAATTKIAGLAFDEKNRLYVAAGSGVTLFDGDGNNIGTIGTDHIDFFTVDKAGYVYVLSNDAVAKYAPIP